MVSLSLCVCWFAQVWVRTKQVSRTISRSTRGRCRYFCLNTTSSCDAYVTAYTSTSIHSLQVYHLQCVSSLPLLLLLLRPLHCIIEMWMLVWVWRRTINWTMPTRHGTRRVARTTRYWTCWRTPIRAAVAAAAWRRRRSDQRSQCPSSPSAWSESPVISSSYRLDRVLLNMQQQQQLVVHDLCIVAGWTDRRSNESMLMMWSSYLQFLHISRWWSWLPTEVSIGPP